MREPPNLTSEDATIWFSEALPEHWFSDLRVLVDRDEILVMGTLAPETDDDAEEEAGADDESAGAEPDEVGIIEEFREETREERIRVAQRAEARFRRKVSWGARCGDTEALFTHLSVPVMTRLRLRERHILDTLVAAGVARSRSDALGWCVRLVAKHENDWLEELRQAIKAVDEVRASGPS